MEFSRLFSRSILIGITLALLTGSGPAAFAMGPGLSTGEQRPTPNLPRYFTINEILAKRDSQSVNTSASSHTTAPAAADTAGPAANAVPPAADIPSSTEPFGLVTFRAPEGLLWVKWRTLVRDLQFESRILSHCRAEPDRCENPVAAKFLRLIEQTRRLPANSRLDHLNRTINASVRYVTDQAQHGVPDHWSAPLATLGSGQGDCEDYAIAKYVALRLAGYSADDLRLLLVHDRVAHQDHAVVGVRQDGRWLLLDNRHEVLLEQKDAWHFTPLFALDQQGVRLFAAPVGAPPATVPARVATAPIDTAPALAAELDASAEGVPELRLDAFEPPALRGRL